jgi:hypothetical protein
VSAWCDTLSRTHCVVCVQSNVRKVARDLERTLTALEVRVSVSLCVIVLTVRAE